MAASALSVMHAFRENNYQSWVSQADKKHPDDSDTLWVYEEHEDVLTRKTELIKTSTYINNCLVHIDFDYIGYYLLEVGDNVEKEEPCHYCDHPQNRDGHCFMCYNHPRIQKHETWVSYLFLSVHAGEWKCEWLDERPARFFDRPFEAFDIIRRFNDWAEGRHEERKV